MKMRWIDTHIHVSDRGPDGSRRERLLSDLLHVLDPADAELRFVISPDDYWNDEVRAQADGVHRANEFIYRLVAEAPESLYGSCIVNPNWLDASLRAMENCFERWGFRQLGEMLPYMFGFKMNCDRTERVVRQAAEYGVPIQVHLSTSNARTYPSSFGREQLLDLFGLVERVPHARYILAHAVGTCRPVVEEYVDLVERRFRRWPQNFWLEIANFSSPGVRTVLARVPRSRLLCGTDWTTRVGPPFLPYGTIFGVRSVEENPFPPSVSRLAALLREAGATEEDVRQIGFGNAATLLGIREPGSGEKEASRNYN